MKKTFLLVFLAIMLSVSLLACTNSDEASVNGNAGNAEAGANEQGVSADAETPQAADSPSGDYDASQLIQGSFALESTDLAITKEQAVVLLPLWKAYKAISASSTSSTVEQEALVKQISESMTTAQLELISTMTFGPETMAALMEELGIEGTVGMGGFGQNRDMTEEERESFLNSEEGQLLREAMPEGGPGGGMGGGMGGGLGGGVDMDPEQLATLQAEREANGGGFRANAADTILLDPLIELLSSKVQ